MKPADDPLLTTSAIDTPPPADQARLGGLLAASPEARATLETIRAQAEALRKEYAAAPKPPPLSPADDLFSPQHQEALDAVVKKEERKAGVPLWLWAAGIGLAAAAALFLILHAHPSAPPSISKRETAVPPPAAPTPRPPPPSIVPPPPAVPVPPPSLAAAPSTPPTAPFPNEMGAPASEEERAPQLEPTGPGALHLTPGPMHPTTEGAPPGFTLPEFVPAGASGPAPDASGAVTEEEPGLTSADYGAGEAAKTAPLPFTLHSKVIPSPLDPSRRLLVVSLEAVAPAKVERPRANLVFLVDDSITMGDSDRLPLFKQAFAQFLNRLEPDDHVALVVYVGDSALLLPPTPVRDKMRILAAFNGMASVSTGRPGASLQIAYDVARQNLLPGGFNRIIAVTDGDLNLGVGETGGLYDYVARQAHDGITLSVLGVGREFAVSAMSKKLIVSGLGRASATHTEEAIEVALDKEIALPPPAKLHDVKMEIALSPQTAAAYRLVGYQNRLPLAGSGLPAEAGAGVLAVYEIEPLNRPGPVETRLRYHRAYPDAPEETLSQTAGDSTAAPAESAPEFDREVAGIQTQLGALTAPPAPAPAPVSAAPPIPDPEQPGTITPRAVSDFQKNAGAWIEPAKKADAGQ